MGYYGVLGGTAGVLAGYWTDTMVHLGGTGGSRGYLIRTRVSTSRYFRHARDNTAGAHRVLGGNSTLRGTHRVLAGISARYQGVLYGVYSTGYTLRGTLRVLWGYSTGYQPYVVLRTANSVEQHWDTSGAPQALQRHSMGTRRSTQGGTRRYRARC